MHENIINDGLTNHIKNKDNSGKTINYPSHRFSVAPMLDWTDRHCRFFHRLLTKQAQLYTEMITTGAILHGKADYLLFNQQELPVVLQLGGSDPQQLAQCAKLAESRGYSEINLNVGCPSDRVQNGAFGACLMANAPLVAECVAAMRQAVTIPVTVKTRLGIDDWDSYAFLCDFIGQITEQGGCQQIILHARKAWLSGLSPKQNRDVPPLDYARVYQIKQDFPQLVVVVNGGITDLAQAKAHLAHVDGVMIGRAAYQNPQLLAQVDSEIFAQPEQIDARQVVQAMYPYIESELAKGTYLGNITRHMLGLFQGQIGARRWRRYLSEHAHKKGADCQVLVKALAQLDNA